MKNYAKVGGRRGSPAYRTPSSYRIRRQRAVRSLKAARHSQ